MDAISAPRLDLTKKGKKIMTTEFSSESDSSKEETNREGSDDGGDLDGDEKARIG